MQQFENLKARILKSIITRSEMEQQTAQAETVQCPLAFFQLSRRNYGYFFDAPQNSQNLPFEVISKENIRVCSVLQ